MSERELIAASLAAAFPAALLPTPAHDHDAIAVAPRWMEGVGELLRDDPELRYDLLLAIVRQGDHLCYQLASTRRRRRQRLYVPLGEDGVRSLAFVWPAANWAEREAGEQWGVEFAGHPRPGPLFSSPSPIVATHPAGAEGKLLSAGTCWPACLDGLFVRLLPAGAEPMLGYRRVGVERRFAEWPYTRGTLLAARTDGCVAMHGDLAYALAVEKILGVVPPARAVRLRAIYAELQRIASHLGWLVRFVQLACGPLLAAISYAWEGRTMLLDFFQWLGGNPITPDVIAVGGLRRDAPPGWEDELAAILARLDTLLDDLERLLTDSVDFRSRLEGVGVIDPGTALGLGVTGPVLRATGIVYDVRVAFPYADCVSEVNVAVEHAGDALARYLVRMAEMRAGISAVRQAMVGVPSGAVNAFSPGDVPPCLPVGVAYAAVEGARGEWGVLVVGDGETRPALVYLRAPSFANLSALPFITRGLPPEQVALALTSLDIAAGEVER